MAFRSRNCKNATALKGCQNVPYMVHSGPILGGSYLPPHQVLPSQPTSRKSRTSKFLLKVNTYESISHIAGFPNLPKYNGSVTSCKHIDDVTLALTRANRQHLDGATFAKLQKNIRAKRVPKRTLFGSLWLHSMRFLHPPHIRCYQANPQQENQEPKSFS